MIFDQPNRRAILFDFGFQLPIKNLFFAILTLLFVFYIPLLSADDDSITTPVQLKHIDAPSLIEVIQPHLPLNVKLSGKGHQLLVTSSLKELETIKTLIGSLDKLPMQYLVTLKVQTSPMVDPSKIHLKRYTTNSTNAVRNYQLRLSENALGFIITGKSQVKNNVQAQYGHLLPQSKKQAVSSGFHLLIRQIAPNRVALNLSTKEEVSQRYNLDIKQFLNYASELTANLNQWTLIASNHSDNLSATSNHWKTPIKLKQAHWYYLLVQPID